MKVAYVVPRYGPQIRGGAETGARMLAEHLVADRGDQVEVFTSAALDALTWRDELPLGTESINGVTVHRIGSEAGRGEGFHPLSGRLLADPAGASEEDCERWVDLQGPKSPDLLRAVEASDADIIAFYPYLYYPTIRGLPLVRDRSILHPAAHEEPALHLRVFDALFAQCPGFAFHTRSERRLVVEPRRRWWSAWGSKRRKDHRGRRGRRSDWATRPISCASGGWTTKRGRESSGGTSGPTRSATPVISNSSWWGRSSTLPTPAATLS